METEAHKNNERHHIAVTPRWLLYQVPIKNSFYFLFRRHLWDKPKLWMFMQSYRMTDDFFMLYLMKHLKEWGKEKQHQAPSDSAVSHTSWQQVDQLFVLLNPGDGCLTRVSVLSLDRKWPNVQRKHRDDADDFLRKHCVSWPDEQHSR